MPFSLVCMSSPQGPQPDRVSRFVSRLLHSRPAPQDTGGPVSGRVTVPPFPCFPEQVPPTAFPGSPWDPNKPPRESSQGQIIFGPRKVSEFHFNVIPTVLLSEMANQAHRTLRVFLSRNVGAWGGRPAPGGDLIVNIDGSIFAFLVRVFSIREDKEEKMRLSHEVTFPSTPWTPGSSPPRVRLPAAFRKTSPARGAR